MEGCHKYVATYKKSDFHDDVGVSGQDSSGCHHHNGVVAIRKGFQVHGGAVNQNHSECPDSAADREHVEWQDELLNFVAFCNSPGHLGNVAYR